jgi:hypothetical protein
MMYTITFRCPTSGKYVQHRCDAGPNAARASFILVLWQNHFINGLTHKLLGHEDDRGECLHAKAAKVSLSGLCRCVVFA